MHNFCGTERSFFRPFINTPCLRENENESAVLALPKLDAKKPESGCLAATCGREGRRDNSEADTPSIRDQPKHSTVFELFAGCEMASNASSGEA
jgi:hypothetical protein